MEKKDIVGELRTLLGSDVLLLHCRTRTKKPFGKWKHLTADSMEDPAYLAGLGRGNIGVVLGQRSGGLCSLDIDSDDGFNAFNELNPALCQTLCTRGARGCNFWWRLEGRYPTLTPLKLGGIPWGEWRSDGAQTMIWGVHPDGERYRFLRRAKPLTIAFEDIRWPANMDPALSPGLELDDTERTQSTETPESTQTTERTQDTQEDRSGKGVSASLPSPPPVVSVEQALVSARTRAPGGNHKQLFKLARGVRGVELSRGKALSEGELKSVFGRWFEEAKPHLKQGLGADDYWFEFMDGYDNVDHPLGTGVMELAWARAQTEPPPAIAQQFEDMNLRLIVSLCRELWLAAKREPFFVSCRTVQRLLGHPDHIRAARWLRGLVRSKILEVVEIGGPSSNKATRYRYLPAD